MQTSGKSSKLSKNLSTRATEATTTRDASMYDSLKRELRESQEMVQDLQSLLKVNKEAIKLVYSPQADDASQPIMENYRQENDMLLLMVLKLFMKNQYLIKDNYVEHKLNEDDQIRFNKPNLDEDTREIKIHT